MPRISRIEILEMQEQPVLCIRTRTDIKHLPMVIGEGYGKLAQYVAQLGETLSDVPYVAYYNTDMEDLDVEMGFPVARTLQGKENIQYRAIPKGKNVFAMFLGAYRDIAPVYADMAKWLEEKGLEPEGTAYEYYYNDAEFPEDQYLTKVVMPVK